MALALRNPALIFSLRHTLTTTSRIPFWTTHTLFQTETHQANTTFALKPLLPTFITTLAGVSTWPTKLSDRLQRKWQSIWDSVLRAVPKKKTSHMKKRHRQMAGKALKDVSALNKCSACGNTKRAHLLCPHCVASVQRWFREEGNAGPGAAVSP